MSDRNPDTDAVPVVEPAVDGARQLEQPSTAETPPRGLRARLAASVADPVLRILVISTAIGRIGRGVFLTITVLYFTLIVGLSPVQVAIVLTVASAVGVASSAVGGQLADRFSARRQLVVCMALQGVGLIAYVFATSFPAALVIGALVGGVDAASNATRMAIIARAFEGPARVNARAILRTITNVSIAAGSAIGGIALVIGTPEAYRGVMIGAGVVFLSSVFVAARLPRRVDAPPREPFVATETRPTASVARRAHSPWLDPRFLAITALSAIFGMQFALFEVGVPIWVAHDTVAPTAVVSALLILNTVVVVIFQVPLSRGTHDVRRAGTVTAWAGMLMAAACGLYFAASVPIAWLGTALLVVAALAHAFAEVFSQAGGWGLSFELADPAAPGAYQGLFAMGYNVGSMVAPLAITAALAWGVEGWAAMAAVFLASALGTTAIAWRAAAQSVAV